MSKDNGGPAFPTEYGAVSGMTLRDYMAVHASEEDVQRFMAFDRSISRTTARYRHADLMLLERAK